MIKGELNASTETMNSQINEKKVSNNGEFNSNDVARDEITRDQLLKI